MPLTVLKYIIVLFIGAALSYFVWPGLMKAIDIELFGKAEVIVNITELHPIISTGEQSFQNVSYIFRTANGEGMLVAFQTNNPVLNSLFGVTLVPIDFDTIGDRIEYSVTMVNIGKRTANNLTLSFSGDNLETDYDIDVSTNIDYANCGGFGGKHKCEFRIKKFKTEDKGAVFVRADSPSIEDINCNLKTIGDCSVNTGNFYIVKIQQGQGINLIADGKVAPPLPEINNNQQDMYYYYSSEKNEWVVADLSI